MSEPIEQIKNEIPKERTKAEIDQEYSQCAMKAGDVEFKIQRLKAEANGYYNRMRQLEKEATSILNKPSETQA